MEWRARVDRGSQKCASLKKDESACTSSSSVCTSSLGLGGLHVVGGAAVLGLVEAGSLLLGGGAEHARGLEGKEETADGGTDPEGDDDDTEDLVAEELAAAAEEGT